MMSVSEVHTIGYRTYFKAQTSVGVYEEAIHSGTTNFFCLLVVILSSNICDLLHSIF